MLKKCFECSSKIYDKSNLNKRIEDLSVKKMASYYSLDINITDICFGLFVSLNGFQLLFNIIWNNLTPGQKGLELATIVISIVTVIIIGLLAIEFEKKIDQTMTKLQVEIANKNNVIAEKNDKILKLEKIIDDYVETTNAIYTYRL